MAKVYDVVPALEFNAAHYPDRLMARFLTLAAERIRELEADNRRMQARVISTQGKFAALDLETRALEDCLATMIVETYDLRGPISGSA